MDPYWYVELQEKGVVDYTTLVTLPTIMRKVSQAMFPIHQRRMEVFDCKQKSVSKTYLRELIDKVRMAEWKTFNEQAAVCHLFMQGCKSEEARKACFKIITDTPAGCTKTLMEKLGEIDSFPKDDRGPNAHVKAVKQEEYNTPEKVCTDCKRTGHLKVDCWGKCSFCGCFGHKAEICRERIKKVQKETAKKALLLQS